jgi:hypothetical protein
LGHLPLGLVQCLSVMDEFFTVHRILLRP